MTAKECLQILREIKDVAFATTDLNGSPQVRIIDVMLVENNKLYFCTARGKSFYEELMLKNETSIVGINKNYQMIRLKGKVEKLANQHKWIDKIFNENPSMSSVYPGESRYILEPFCIANGWIEFFDLSKEPIYRKSFPMGEGKVEEKGFFITKGCIGCGKCSDTCPQKCITKNEKYEIHQDNCLHCGLCFELCPVGAVERRRK